MQNSGSCWGYFLSFPKQAMSDMPSDIPTSLPQNWLICFERLKHRKFVARSGDVVVYGNTPAIAGFHLVRVCQTRSKTRLSAPRSCLSTSWSLRLELAWQMLSNALHMGNVQKTSESILHICKILRYLRFSEHLFNRYLESKSTSCK